MFILIVLTCFGKDRKSPQQTIERLFYTWCDEELKKDHYLTFDSCENFISYNKNKGKFHNTYPSDIRFSFYHINNDSILDCIVTFFPSKCPKDKMATQSQVLILSEGSRYYIDKDFFLSLYKKCITDDRIASMSVDTFYNGAFYGRFNNFKDNPVYEIKGYSDDNVLFFKDDKSNVPLKTIGFNITYVNKRLNINWTN